VKAAYCVGFDYASYGHGYAVHRRTEPRIAAELHRALGSSRTVLNVGAGTGSYEPEDRYVLAVEPSAAMRAHRPGGQVPAIAAVAEDLPIDDGQVDASMAVLTVHHWSDPEKGLREMRRVTRDRVLVLTIDAQALDRFWLADYAPEVIAGARKRFPDIERVCSVLGGQCQVRDIPIPADCADGFAAACYARPEAFLDPAVRQAQSCWGALTAAEEDRAIGRLRTDLESGEWDRRYESWRAMKRYEGVLKLIVARPGT